MCKNTAFQDRLTHVGAEDLDSVLSYVAEETCCEGFDDLVEGDCGCVVCMARRIYAAIWPADTRTVAQGIVSDVLDFVDDARSIYRPESMLDLGLGSDDVSALTKSWGDVVGVLGLDLIEWLAGRVGVEQTGYDFLGWQRIVRATKAAIRRKVGLPAVAGEDE